MSDESLEIDHLHLLLDMVESLDVGLIVLDRQYRVRVWNRFISNHSGLSASRAIGRVLFEIFPEIPQRWFQQKVEPVYVLRARAFTTWELRPCLFRFRNYRPITGPAEFMYQNVTVIPLVSTDGTVNHIGVIVYDVTDMAVSRLELGKANAELERLSRTDRLTGLNNRGYLEECLAAEFRRVGRTKRPTSLVMFDIDHFKRVNDTYGHPAGDEVIRQTSRLLRETMRLTDIAGRYGGEEFVVVLIETGGQDACIFAERLRNTIASSPVTHEDDSISYTISLGIAELTEDMANQAQWLEAADSALYASKHGGRNRTTLHPPPAPETAPG